MKKKILVVIALIFIIGQFIRPKQNLDRSEQPNRIDGVLSVDFKTQDIITRACMDCHSNYTNYPWYNKVFPVSWFLYNHVYGGIKHLNFDSFATLGKEEQRHKLEEIIEVMEEDRMPLYNYVWLHPEAALTPDEKGHLIEWAKNSLKKY